MSPGQTPESSAAHDQQRLDTGESGLKISQCRSCRGSIIWCRTERGSKMPLDAKPVDGYGQGTVFVLRDRGSYEGPLAISAWGLAGTEPHYVSHFATCPNAGEHRSRTPMRDARKAREGSNDNAG